MWWGRPYNNFLVTCFHALGVPKAEYVNSRNDGFGSYFGGHSKAEYTRFTDSSGARHAPLPGWYLG